MQEKSETYNRELKHSYSYFQNQACEYFPCHKAEGEYFNCLFCYCPLYALGEKCGGDYTYLANGIKDCSNCLVPHREGGYEYVNERFQEIAAMAKRKEI